MKSYLRFILVVLVVVVVQQSVVGYPMLECNVDQSPLIRTQRKADPNMALLMAFTSKNKSKIPLSTSKKSQTYMLGSSESAELQHKNKQNMKLIQSLIKNGHVEYLKMDPKTKRENINQSENSSEVEESIESIELMRSVKNSKKSCYKDVYTNVLEAFQMALKKEIAEYKKCLCKKNKTMTTTTTMATTTTSTTTTTTTPMPIDEEDFFDNDANDARNIDSDEEASMGSALENPSDVICMHKKYAIMLNKFLDAMHCDKDNAKTTTKSSHKETKGVRTQRNNEQRLERSEKSEKLDNVEVEKRQQQQQQKGSDKKDRPTDAIFQLFKQLHEFEIKNQQHQIGTSDNQIVKKRMDSESISASETSGSVEDDVDEALNQKLLKQLKALFQEYELSQDNGTFLHSTENTSGSFIQESTKKSARKTAVQEDSTESTEATVILKNHKNKAKSAPPKETIGSKSKSTTSNSNSNTSTIHRRPTANHKSAHDGREKLSLNVKIPKSSSNILVKKIQWN
ncbi:unnamed protein product [Diamesa serratosioi]